MSDEDRGCRRCEFKKEKLAEKDQEIARLREELEKAMAGLKKWADDCEEESDRAEKAEASAKEQWAARNDAERRASEYKALAEQSSAKSLENHVRANRAEARVKELEAELERERGRLAACGVFALGDTRPISQEYESASLQDVRTLLDRAAKAEAKVSTFEEVAKQDAKAINDWAERYRNLEAALAAMTNRATRLGDDVHRLIEESAGKDKIIAAEKEAHAAVMDSLHQAVIDNQHARGKFTQFRLERYALSQEVAALKGVLKKWVDCKCDSLTNGGWTCPRCVLISSAPPTHYALVAQAKERLVPLTKRMVECLSRGPLNMFSEEWLRTAKEILSDLAALKKGEEGAK